MCVDKHIVRSGFFNEFNGTFGYLNMICSVEIFLNWLLIDKKLPGATRN